jgi:hypothetical protein
MKTLALAAALLAAAPACLTYTAVQHTRDEDWKGDDFARFGAAEVIAGALTAFTPFAAEDRSLGYRIPAGILGVFVLDAMAATGVLALDRLMQIDFDEK